MHHVPTKYQQFYLGPLITYTLNQQQQHTHTQISPNCAKQFHSHTDGIYTATQNELIMDQCMLAFVSD